MGYIVPEHYHRVTSRLRDFFLSKGWIEAYSQDRLSIMAACEDPETIATYLYDGQLRPLPQTGQMWLEHELLTQPHVPGFFHVSTSYRQEPNPVPGRHETIFPLFEFETHGDMETLRALGIELLEYMGFGTSDDFFQYSYDELATKYETDDITGAHELQMRKDFGPVVFMTDFPLSTSPFWNMKRSGDYAKKIDVMLYGMETIGSAERSCNVDEMREEFLTICDGGYAQKLFDIFGKERVMAEFDDFLSYDFFPRCGGAVGLTRMIRAMQLHGLLEESAESTHFVGLRKEAVNDRLKVKS